MSCYIHYVGKDFVDIPLRRPLSYCKSALIDDDSVGFLKLINYQKFQNKQIGEWLISNIRGIISTMTPACMWINYVDIDMNNMAIGNI